MTFAILLEETVLRYRLGDAGVMAGQLGSLLSAMDLPSVSLGIIPASAERIMWPIESFTVFDDERVDHEPLSASVKITAPDEVVQYLKAFGELHRHAVYGAEARALILKAIEALH
ncbi:Scr1 family TA system antitoxin-like transcriptional regulator [Streptomyces sp. NPDC059474]|uniref:Scr1 family TA system antitoxin-like transcriptional regulator n=1 Tax=Streptomyces sp. NPDC059474 TaxID=3346846 RepID=UPI00367D0B8A